MNDRDTYVGLICLLAAGIELGLLLADDLVGSTMYLILLIVFFAIYFRGVLRGMDR